MLSQILRKIEDKKATIGVIGLGYVGLPVACTFTRAGFRVVGIDILSSRVDKINAGISPIEGDEPGLAELLSQVMQTGQFRATTDYSELREADIITISVETPIDAENRPNYRALKSALHGLANVLKNGVLVIVESTLAPGTMDSVVKSILERERSWQVNQDFFLGYCPERVMPGRLLYNLQNLSRVCGGSSLETANVMASLYRHITLGDLDTADCLTAEIVKTTENAYRDVQIAFANEIALLCESLGANVWDVRELVNKSPGRNMHLPGAGVGGHCIPKDSWLLIANTQEDFNPRIIPQARKVNDLMPNHMFELTVGALAESGVSVQQATVAIFGYAYLENSDDTRNTPSEPLIERLRAAGATVCIHDPFVPEYRNNWQDTARDADAAVFLVAHSQYRTLDMNQLKNILRNPVLIDGRHIFDPQSVEEAGFIVRSLGVAK